MSWKLRNDALVTPFSSFHSLGKLDRTSAVVSERASIGKYLVNDKLANQNARFIQVMQQ